MVKIDKKFNINKYFQSYVPILKEVFLEYYGDEYADKINNAFANFSFIGYLTPVAISNLVFDLNNEIRRNLVDDFIFEAEFNDIPNFKVNAFLFSFEDKEKCSFYKALQRTNGYEEDVKLMFGINSKSEDYKEKLEIALKRIDAARSIYFKYQKLFDEAIKPYQEYVDIANRLENLEENSTPDFIIYFINRIFHFLSKEDKEFYLINQEKFTSDDTASEYFRKMKCFKNYVSYYSDYISFNQHGYINSFSKEKCEKMENPQGSSYVSYIKKERIKYFNNLGIDLGNNYEDYLNNPEVQRLWPSPSMVDKIEKIKEELYEETIRSFFLTIPLYQENKRVLEETGFIDKRVTAFQFATYLENNWNTTSNFVKKANLNNSPIEDGFILHPIIIFSAQLDNNQFDNVIIHELNHLIENHIKSIIKKITETGSTLIQILTESGFNCPGDTEYIQELKKYKYELFNETINQIIANQITELLHKKGIYLFTEPELKDKKDDSVCIYEYSVPLAINFFNEFKKDIIYARITGDRSLLFAKIGENNFEDLNDLINKFYSYFGIVDDTHHIQMDALNALERGEINDEVKAYQEFIDGSNIIIERMKIESSKMTKKRKLSL